MRESAEEGEGWGEKEWGRGGNDGRKKGWGNEGRERLEKERQKGEW